MQRSPSQELLNVNLPGGWSVIEDVSNKTLTGGCFSAGYIAKHEDGRHAFLKAMDYSQVFHGPLETLAIRLEAVTATINHERTLLSRCKNHRLTKVIRALDSGQYKPIGGNALDTVEYLIFELAQSDVRYHLDSIDAVAISWKFKVLHQIAVGLRQLHQIGIAHQDIKPSNILIMERENVKIADLGRAVCNDLAAPHADLPIPGDPTYASPESSYSLVPRDWNARRIGCDCYLLGSMVAYFFSGQCMTELLFSRLDDRFHPRNWDGSYKDVLPYLQEAFGHIIRDMSSEIPIEIRESVIEILVQLANPDYEERGHPANRRSLGNQYSLERYIGKFNLLHWHSLIGKN